jgi:hypothetical protein
MRVQEGRLKIGRISTYTISIYSSFLILQYLYQGPTVVAPAFRDLNHIRHPFKLYLRPRSVHASGYPHVPFKELDAIQLRGSFYRSRTPTLLLQYENR